MFVRAVSVSPPRRHRMVQKRSKRRLASIRCGACKKLVPLCANPAVPHDARNASPQRQQTGRPYRKSAGRTPRVAAGRCRASARASARQ